MIYHHPIKNAVSEGFNSLGKPVKYRSAQLAGCGIGPIPADHLEFYAPLSSSSATAETGQTLTADGSVSFTTVLNIPCASFSTGKIDIGSVFSSLQTGASFTCSLWAKTDAETAGHGMGLVQYSPGRSGDGTAGLGIGVNQSNQISVGNAGSYSITGTSGNTSWRHIAATGDANGIKLYVNGLLEASGTMWNINPDSRTPFIGNTQTQYSTQLIGCIAAVRLYSRVLSSREITALSREFTPTAS